MKLPPYLLSMLSIGAATTALGACGEGTDSAEQASADQAVLEDTDRRAEAQRTVPEEAPSPEPALVESEVTARHDAAAEPTPAEYDAGFEPGPTESDTGVELPGFDNCPACGMG